MLRNITVEQCLDCPFNEPQWGGNLDDGFDEYCTKERRYITQIDRGLPFPLWCKLVENKELNSQ
jgi:hypothetical protein